MKTHRPERVASVIREVVSEAIATKLSDPRIAVFTSVTRVEVTPDLEYARVYVSVMGDVACQRRTLAGLVSARGVVQRMLGRQLTTRHIPQLIFRLDESLKKAAETMRLIDQTMAEYHSPPAAGETDVDAEDPQAEDEADQQSDGERA